MKLLDIWIIFAEARVSDRWRHRSSHMYRLHFGEGYFAYPKNCGGIAMCWPLSFICASLPLNNMRIHASWYMFSNQNFTLTVLQRIDLIKLRNKYIQRKKEKNKLVIDLQSIKMILYPWNVDILAMSWSQSFSLRESYSTWDFDSKVVPYCLTVHLHIGTYV